MKWVINIVAVLLILPGGIFLLQGIRLLPSPLMYGRPEWVVIGAAMVLFGGALVVAANRRQGARQ